jgi:hypothetical protein
MGLGWLHLRRKGGEMLWHDGGTVGFGSFVALDLGRDLAVAVLSNFRYLLWTGRAAFGLVEALGS